jgi:two-component system chemotaxis response regulator CheB
MISVLVVDDSVVVRRLIVDALTDVPGIVVVGTAANGLLAQEKVDQLKPDIITMDIEMPQMDGVTAVRELRKRHRHLPVIMFSTLSVSGATATLEAIAAGATDYVTKPSNVGSITESIAAVREQLVPRIIALGGRRRPPGSTPPSAPPSANRPNMARPAPGPSGTVKPPTAPAGVRLRTPAAGGAAVPARPAGRPSTRVEILAIGSSTGGPDALTVVLQAMPSDLSVPIVITQHMPPVFTKMFAERLNRNTRVTVVEAEDGMTLEPGTVYIAPGDRHLVLQRRGTATRTQLSTAPPENSCRPAVDVMFRSVSELYGPSAYAAVLTGMGQDGREGARVLRKAGAEVLVQDEATSVVWGMPGAVASAGLADLVLPLDQIGSALISRVSAARSSQPTAVAK